MSEASSLLRRKRERSPRPPTRGSESTPLGGGALERLAAVRRACIELEGQPYNVVLNELAGSLQEIFSARLVVIRDTSPGEPLGLAPAGIDPRDWLDTLEPKARGFERGLVRSFQVPPGEAWPRASGIDHFVVVPLDQIHGRGSVWLGFANGDAPSAEEQPTFELLGDIVGFALFRISLEASSVEAARAGSTGPDLTTGEIISLAAHELRTPLTPATMLLQSLERKARSGVTDVDAIVRTRRQVGRLSQMVADLLDLTRLREGRLVLTPVLLEVGSCLSRAISAFRESDPRRRVDLSMESEPLVILSDEDRFSQAITALLDHIARQPPVDSAIQVTLARRSDRAAIRIACERPPFPPDPDIVTAPPRPAPLPLSAILAQALVMRFGGTMTFTVAHDSPSAVEVTFPVSTADKG